MFNIEKHLYAGEPTTPTTTTDQTDGQIASTLEPLEKII